MASRIDYSQNRKLYVGTTSELSVADGGVVVDNQLILGGTGSSYMLDVLSSASIGSRNVGSNTTNFENKLVIAGKNNYSDGTTWYGDYGQILLSSTSNMTGSARQFLITNALDNNKFAIIRSVDAGTNPVTNSTGNGVNSGTADFVINNTGNVGIGTTSPDYKFEVQGVISSADSALQKATFANVGADLVLTANADATNVTAKILFNSSGAGGGTVSEKMSIQGDGSVVIGSSAVGGSKRLLMLSADNAVNYDIDFQQNGTTDFGRIRYTEGASDLQFFPITGVDPNLTLKYNGSSYFSRGNVGISDTTNNAKLGINGGAVKIKNIVSSSPGSDVRRNINIATFDGQGSTFTGKLIIETPVMTTGAMATFKISGWQYDESWDLTVSGYLRFGTGRGWQQTGGAILTGNPPFDVDEVRLCYNDTTNIFYIILGIATTFWDYYASIVIDADSYYQDSVPTTGWDMSIATADPSGLTSDVTPTVAKYGSSDAVIPSQAAIGLTAQGLGKLTVKSSSGVSTFYNNIQCVPSDASSGGLVLGSNVANDAVIVTGAFYKNAGKYTPTATSASIINLTSGQMRFFGDTGLTVGTEYTPTRNFTLYPGGEVQLNTYDSTNQVGTPTYLLGVRSDGQIVKTNTGATTGTQVHSLAATGGTSSWKKLGTFTAAHGGQSAFIKMVTNNGYNSSTGQNVEVYIRFKTSNGGSLDPNGFSGDSSFYTHGQNNAFPAGNIKWVSDAAGTSATSYALYALIPAYSGNGGFYVVENSAGTWVNNMTNASDPGAASTTVMIPAEQFSVGSTDFVVNGGGGDAYFANSKVGIGRTDPEGTGTDLDVYGAGYFGYQDYRDHNTYPPQKAFVLRGAPVSGAYAQSRFNWYTKSGTTSNGIAAIQIKSQYGTDGESDVLFHLGSSGELGIGTDSPAAGLDIKHASAALITRSTNNNGIAMYNEISGGYSNLYLYQINGSAKVVLAGNGDSYFNGGNVGINDTSPSNKLDVNGDIRATQYNLRGNVSNPTSTAVAIYDQASVGLTLSAHNTSFRSYDGSNMMESARLVHDKLTVAGDVIAYGSPSDKRLKENIKPIESALDKVSKLQGVTFDWKQKKDSILELKEDIGFIAQDVKKVLPELVRKNKDGILSMRHQGIAPILLEAIKELKAEIEDLKKKIK